MKKSKAVAIGLVALSVASCTPNRNRQKLDDYQRNPNYYVDNGGGYSHGGVSPFWVFWAYSMGNGGRFQSQPTYVHQSYGRNGTYHATSMGQTTRMTSSHMSSKGTISRGSVSRGGFGHSGGVSSSSSGSHSSSAS